MKTRNLFIAAVCGFVLGGAVFAQQKRALSVNPRMETVLRMVSDSEKGVEFNNRLGGVDKAETFVLPQAAYTVQSVNGVPQEFTVLSVQDYAFTNKKGFPMLPVRVELMEVPQGAVPRVVYGKVAYKDIDLAKAGYPQPLYPVQPPVSKSAKAAPDFAYDAAAYRADVFWADGSDELVEVKVLGEMRATRIAKVVVKPVQYNAATHTLRVYTALDFEIVYDQADWDATYAKKERYASPAFGLLRHEVANPIKTKTVSANRPMRYVIVANPMFKQPLQTFVDWKTRFGYEVVQAYIGQPEVGNTPESIRAYLKGLYENATETDPAPSYVLFVGDLAQVPTKTYGQASWDGSGKHYSDLYLCEYTGDHFPEVHYGRMSASSVGELIPQINKTIYMESLTPGQAAFLDTYVAVAGYDGKYDFSHLNPTVNYICNYYMKDTLNSHVYKYLSTGTSSTKSNDIIRNINDGASVVVYTGHGVEDGWHNPYIGVSDVNNSMNNVGKYPLMIGNCCLTGKFDEATCYAEALLRKKDAGAVVYIGASDVTYFDQDVYWAIGYTNRLVSGVVQTYEKTELGAFDALNHTHGEPYQDWAMTAHEIVYAGNMAVQRANQDFEDYYWEVYHVFGDPSYMPYTYRADYPQVDCPKTLEIVDVFMKVNTVPYARIALIKDSVIYGFATADRHGLAEIEFTGIDTALTLNLTVAAQNYLPYHGKVEVLAPAGKYVTVVKQEIFDTAGTPVQSGLYGQSYKLRYTLRNVGRMELHQVDARLVSQDEYLSVDNADYTFSQALQPGEEAVLEHDFILHVNPNVPDQHKVRFALEMKMDGDADSVLARNGKLLVKAPELRVAEFRVDDSAGINPNGVIDNGEMVKAMVTFENSSEIDAQNVRMQVSSQAEYLNLPDSVFEIGFLASGDKTTLTFEYSANKVDAHYGIYTLDFIFDIKGRRCTAQAQSYINPMVETFESGDFSFVKWDKSSDWVIDRSRAHQGVYSAASADIADNGTSSLLFEMDVPMDDKVGFYLMTSSEMINENLGDFLNFYIDGERVGRWAGVDEDWRYAEFPLDAGHHVLAWRYTKDASEYKGADKVWLDDIRLPIGSNVANEKTVVAAEPALMQVVRADGGVLEVRFQNTLPLSGNLYVVNAMGQRVRVLASGLRVDAGTGTLSFPLEGLASGVYILVFESGTGVCFVAKFLITM